MEKIFVDTDVIIDLLAEREPHFRDSALLFSAADRKKVSIGVSALSLFTIHHVLSKSLGKESARRKLATFKTLVHVLPVNDKIVELALSSGFADPEDGLQYFTALENNIRTLVTRNLKDYKAADIPVMTPSQFIKSQKSPS